MGWEIIHQRVQFYTPTPTNTLVKSSYGMSEPAPAHAAIETMTIHTDAQTHADATFVSAFCLTHHSLAWGWGVKLLSPQVASSTGGGRNGIAATKDALGDIHGFLQRRENAPPAQRTGQRDWNVIGFLTPEFLIVSIRSSLIILLRISSIILIRLR